MKKLRQKIRNNFRVYASLTCLAITATPHLASATPIYRETYVKKSDRHAYIPPEIPEIIPAKINQQRHTNSHNIYEQSLPQNKLSSKTKSENFSLESILTEEPPKKYTGISKAPFVGPPTLNQFNANNFKSKENIQLAMVERRPATDTPIYIYDTDSDKIDHFANFNQEKAKGRWILVDTNNKTLSVMQDNKPAMILHDISIGRNGITTDKTINDEMTPIGKFKINRINNNSNFKLFFGINYPTKSYAKQAYLSEKIDFDTYDAILHAIENNRTPPQLTDLGGYLGIHGLGKADPEIHERFNWTKGCVAVTNKQIMKLRKYIKLGTIVVIK